MTLTFQAALALAGALSIAAASAQTAPSSSTPGRNAPAVSDVAPQPAEDRGSTGAIVLEQAPVRAQREAQAEAERSQRQAPKKIQGAGALSPNAVRDALRGTGLEDSAKPAR